MEKTIMQQLEDMKNKQYIYKDTVHEILGFLYGCGETGKDVEIYTNKCVIETNVFELPKKLKGFRPIHEQARILAREEQKSVTVLTTDTVNEIRGMVLDQLRKLREQPTDENIKQSKAINDSISALTNLARTELEYRRHYERIKNR